MRKKYYIGLVTSSHDPAIAIVDDEGKVLFAEAAERRYQVKRAIGCPSDNISWAEEIIDQYCSPNADYIITRSWSKSRSRKLRLINATGIPRLITSKRLADRIINATGITPFSLNTLPVFMKNFLAIDQNAGVSIARAIALQSGSALVNTIAWDHHLAHAGLACYGAPFDQAICYVADGEGEAGSFSLFKYQNGQISLLQTQKGPVSLGKFYSWLTYFFDFDSFRGEEWKVMGMAAYGSFDAQLHEQFKSLFYVDGCILKYRKNWSAANETFKALRDRATADKSNFQLRANIAYNGQLAYSEWMNELLTNIHKKYPSDNLILTGGCALNSSHNGMILNKTPFENLYVPSAPADDGNALGGALLAYYADHPHSQSIHRNISPYLGTEITDEQLQHFLQFSRQKVRKLGSDKYDTVAHLLADGKIVGWVQGRAEFGPRALGNRSILADPRSNNIKDIINERVKFREEFRPFAPSILHEHGHEYFEQYQESHYMERTLKFKKDAAAKVPGVVHVDGTGRLQTVKEEWNSEFYHLLKAFHSISGVPVLLNTSFNVMGKPIIHSVEDALATFFTSGLDALVINNYLIEK